MSKFKLRLKLQGLEIEVEGSRDDVPLIAGQLGNQFAGLLQPVAGIVEGEVVETRATGIISPAPVEQRRRPPRRKSRASGSAVPASQEQVTEAVPTWRHDPARWGVPKQDWSAGDKILYFMAVAKAETGQSDFTASAIASGFNTQFRQAGLLNSRNMVRDLGRLKSRGGGLVSEDPSSTPAMWFLTQNGEPIAQQLISSALGAPRPSSPPEQGAGE